MEKADTKKWLDEVKETLFRSKLLTKDARIKFLYWIEFQGSRWWREERWVHQARGRDREAPGFNPQGARDPSEKRGESTFSKVLAANKLIRRNTQVWYVEILKFDPWKYSSAKWCGLHGQNSHQGTFWGMWRLIWWYRLMYLINRSRQLVGNAYIWFWQRTTSQLFWYEIKIWIHTARTLLHNCIPQPCIVLLQINQTGLWVLLAHHRTEFRFCFNGKAVL